ncbi:cation:proton antiporter [Ralstonia solanacearum]|uniref:Cation:proton antiporter n=1 Tax=Ralstonia solanacearum TaxID=305 RepID=A0AAW5ZPQ4_RALSL|nr:cation:proton antiporter [Ralstonia solanacearum]AYB50142.1 cation:proton antiporter [Ralstonia solanacearum]AYB54690.1 cation:proton antiporter [Ralstonia solanacearum]MDB0571490.1 cation:proton antiporter [Ralstonia solanacearum]
MSAMTGLHDLFPSWPPAPGGLFWIGLALVGAALCGEFARVVLRLPRIVGYAVAGLAAGVLGRPLIDADMLGETHILIEMALALALFELGHRLSFDWLRANRWLLLTSAFESLLTWGLVTWLLQAFGVAVPVAVAAGAIAVATSPTVLLQLKNELRAEGQVTERLLSMGALNSIYAGVLVPLTAGWLHSEYGHWGAALLHPLYLLAGSVLMAWVMGKAGHALYHRMAGDDHYAFLVLVGLVLFTLALTKLLKLSVPLTLLLAGVVFKHQDAHPRVWPTHFGSAGSILIVVMIVSLGLPLRVSDWMIGGVAAVVLVLARFVAKLAGTAALGSFSGLSMRQSVALGLALGPMSGLSWLLMHDTAMLYPQTGGPLSAIILCTLAIQQIAAPILTARALRWAGEVRQEEGRR